MSIQYQYIQYILKRNGSVPFIIGMEGFLQSMVHPSAAPMHGILTMRKISKCLEHLYLNGKQIDSPKDPYIILVVNTSCKKK